MNIVFNVEMAVMVFMLLMYVVGILLSNIDSMVGWQKKYMDRAKAKPMPVKVSRIANVITEDISSLDGNKKIRVSVVLTEMHNRRKNYIPIYEVDDTAHNRELVEGFVQMVKREKENIRKANAGMKGTFHRKGKNAMELK